MKNSKDRRKARVRSKVSGTSKRPRLSVFRSNNGLYAQLIDDEAGKTIVSYSSKNLTKVNTKGKTGTEIAGLVGEGVATKAKTKKISKVVFDKGSYKYHGKVKALADGARKGGLIF